MVINMKKKAEFIEWADIKRDAKLPEEDNNGGYIYGIAYLSDDECDTLDCEWFRTNEERYAQAEQENLNIINFIG